MNVKEMIERSRQNVRKRTHEQRMSFLQKARILDDNGYYREDLFSQETVAASKKKSSSSRLTQYQYAN
jgi:hypothetical protein